MTDHAKRIALAVRALAHGTMEDRKTYEDRLAAALRAALPAPPQEAPDAGQQEEAGDWRAAKTFCTCCHPLSVHIENGCGICECSRFDPRDLAEPAPPAEAPPPRCRTCGMRHHAEQNTLCSRFDPEPAEAPPEPPRGTTYQLAPGELSGGPPYPTPGVAPPEERGEPAGLVAHVYTPGDPSVGLEGQCVTVTGIPDFDDDEQRENARRALAQAFGVALGDSAEVAFSDDLPEDEAPAAALNGEADGEVERLRREVEHLRESLRELAAARQQESSLSTAAHVVTKQRRGGGRDEPPHHYAVLPRRATREEALADLKRWEGQQEGEPVAPSWWVRVRDRLFTDDQGDAGTWIADGYEVEPLYPSPPPAAPPADERLREAAKRAVATCGFGTGYQGGSVPVELQAMLDLRAALDAPVAAPPGEPALNRRSDRETLCPECGLGVSVDEDGSCVQCGATATGSAVAGIHGSMRQLELYRKQCENDAAPPAVEMEGPAEGAPAFRVRGSGWDWHVETRAGERVAGVTSVELATTYCDRLNRLFAARPCNAPPPAVETVAKPLIQVIHELLRATEDSQRYLCERCCDEDATRLEVRLSDARRRMDEALHCPVAPPPATSEEPRLAWSQIERIVRTAVEEFRCQHTRDEVEGDGLGLVDALSHGESIREGKEEVESLLDAILGELVSLWPDVRAAELAALEPEVPEVER